MVTFSAAAEGKFRHQQQSLGVVDAVAWSVRINDAREVQMFLWLHDGFANLGLTSYRIIVPGLS
mgnify:CR=1